jgi:hypothetical protein
LRRYSQGRADDLRTRLTDADAGRVAAEARAVDAGAEVGQCTLTL